VPRVLVLVLVPVLVLLLLVLVLVLVLMLMLMLALVVALVVALALVLELAREKPLRRSRPFRPARNGASLERGQQKRDGRHVCTHPKGGCCRSGSSRCGSWSSTLPGPGICRKAWFTVWLPR